MATIRHYKQTCFHLSIQIFINMYINWSTSQGRSQEAKSEAIDGMGGKSRYSRKQINKVFLFLTLKS